MYEKSFFTLSFFNKCRNTDYGRGVGGHLDLGIVPLYALGDDQLNVASLNYVALAGIVIGAIFTWRCFVVIKRNAMLLGERMDKITLFTSHIPFGE